MAPRGFWNGYLKLSLVTCPVALIPATTQGGKVRFRTINRRTGNPVASHYVDSVTGRTVGEEDEVRGYPVEADRHIVMEDDELEALALESTRTIDISMFVPRDSIGWIWHDRPHYLVPDGEVGEEAFAVIRDAMKAAGRVGISRLVIYRRERALMLEPCGKGIVAWTLRYGDEVRDEEDYFHDIEGEKPDRVTMRLMKQLIAERTAHWSPAMIEDPVQDRLMEIVEAKKRKGRKPAPRKKATKPEMSGETSGKVVSIMDALKRSVAAERGKK